MTEIKKCTKCNNEYPANLQYFTRTNNGGVSNLCKNCKAEYDKQYRLQNKEKIKNKTNEYYELHPEKLEEKKEYYKIWKENNKEHLREYREKNKEQKSVNFKIYRHNNLEKLKLNKKIWYYSNLEHVKEYRQVNKERDKEKRKQWYKTPNGNLLSRNRTNRRRQLLNIAGDGITKAQWLECKEFFNCECAYCGNKDNLEQEHIIAISKGGDNSANNIIPACRKCNASKLDKNFNKWFIAQKFYSKEREEKINNYLLSLKGGVALATKI